MRSFSAVVASGHRRALWDYREAGRMDADTWIYSETVVPGGLSHTHITGPKAVSGKNDLPQLVLAGAKGAGTGQQIVSPHAEEAAIIGCLDPVPMRHEIMVPGEQGGIVIRPETVPILKH